MEKFSLSLLTLSRSRPHHTYAHAPNTLNKSNPRKRTRLHRIPTMSSCVMSVQATAPARVASTARPYRRHHRVAVTAAVGAKRSSAHPGRVAVSCRASTSDTGAEVAEVLDGSSLFLVGMMGTGKSSVGKKLAAALGYNFFDT